MKKKESSMNWCYFCKYCEDGKCEALSGLDSRFRICPAIPMMMAEKITGQKIRIPWGKGKINV